MKNFINILKRKLQYYIEINKHVPKKQVEIKAYKELLDILSHCIIINVAKTKYDFDYIVNFLGFISLLDECNISNENVNMVIDSEEGTNSAASRCKFKSLECEKSNEFIGIRIADHIASLFGKLLVAFYNSYYNQQSNKIVKLPKEWFDINNEQFILYKNLNKLFNKKK